VQQDAPQLQNPAPFVVSLKRNTLVFEVMNNVEPSSPQARFPVGTPVSMLPRCWPSGEMTWMPPGPAPKIFPSRSTFIPSGTPGLVSVHSVALNNTLPFPMPPSALTSKTSHTAFPGSALLI
jgi:hypothetical protein